MNFQCLSIDKKKSQHMGHSVAVLELSINVPQQMVRLILAAAVTNDQKWTLNLFKSFYGKIFDLKGIVTNLSVKTADVYRTVSSDMAG